ncbi:MAG: GDP-mannose 4,6-dehydratase [Bacilli bacterium]|nr:GDP-mannose 4,6-dehydratase [Bacilli bacterium]
MKKILIIGINGFVGTHLCNELISNGYECYGADINSDNFAVEGIGFEKLDILNADMVKDVIGRIKPDYIVNLAAISSVKLSWDMPQKTFEVNVNGTINILEAIRKSFLKTRVLLIGSSEQYGSIDYSKPVNETCELNALNPYGISKATQENLAKLYVKAYAMEIIMVRAFNHIGPGQGKGFVVPDFCSQLVEIERGLKEPIIKVGNLVAERDFTDVRDVVKAYRLLLEKGVSGEIYNVGSGETNSIESILKKLVEISGKNIKICIDEAKFRKIDTQKIVCDNMKLVNDTSWKRRYSMNQSLEDILKYWRDRN